MASPSLECFKPKHLSAVQTSLSPTKMTIKNKKKKAKNVAL